MGEMADFTLEQRLREEEILEQFQSGILTTEEAFEAGIIDELGNEY